MCVGEGAPPGADANQNPPAHPFPPAPRPGSGTEGRAGPRSWNSWDPPPGGRSQEARARWEAPWEAGGRLGTDRVLDRTAPSCLQGEPEEGSREAGTARPDPGRSRDDGDELGLRHHRRGEPGGGEGREAPSYRCGNVVMETSLGLTWAPKAPSGPEVPKDGPGSWRQPSPDPGQRGCQMEPGATVTPAGQAPREQGVSHPFLATAAPGGMGGG